jgi:hypothetical protein
MEPTVTDGEKRMHHFTPQTKQNWLKWKVSISSTTGNYKCVSLLEKYSACVLLCRRSQPRWINVSRQIINATANCNTMRWLSEAISKKTLDIRCEVWPFGMSDWANVALVSPDYGQSTLQFWYSPSYYYFVWTVETTFARSLFFFAMMRKWNLLFVNGCLHGDSIPTATKYLNSRQNQTNASRCKGIMTKNNETSVKYMRYI